MEYSAHQIASLINGEIIGDPQVTVNNLSKIEEGSPGTLSFWVIRNTKSIFIKLQPVLSSWNLLSSQNPSWMRPLLKFKNPYQAFAKTFGSLQYQDERSARY